MANHATRIREYQDRYGVDTVENFIDVCCSIDNLIDFYSPFVNPVKEKTNQEKDDHERAGGESSSIRRFATKDYMEQYVNPRAFIKEQEEKIRTTQEENRKFPQRPERGHFKLFYQLCAAGKLAARDFIDRAGRGLLLCSPRPNQDHE